MSEKAIVAMSGGVGGGTIVSADDNRIRSVFMVK